MTCFSVKNILKFLEEINSIFEVFTFEKKDKKLNSEEKELIEKREEARKEKNWDEADRIRDKLDTLGITISDSADGSKWKRTTG